MKKLFFILLALLAVLVSVCSCARNDSAADNADDSGYIVTDDGTWPNNNYTKSLPIPQGKVLRTVEDTANGTFSISLTDLEKADYDSYIAALQDEDFEIVDQVSEEIEGQDYTAYGIVLSGKNGKVGLSISYTPNSMVIYVSVKK